MSQRREPSTTRAARAVVLAFSAAGCSTIAHAVAGGHTPGGASLLLVLGLLTGLALPIAHRATNLASAAFTLTVLQGIAHAGNVVASWGRTLATPPVRDLGHGHHHASHASGSGGAQADALVAGMDPSMNAGMNAGMDSSLTSMVPSAPMLVAHMVAATLLAWAFTSTERSWQVTRRLLDAGVTRPLAVILDQLAGGLRALAAACITPAQIADPPALAPSPDPGRNVWSRPISVRRGPPLLLG